jgi:hypothetical protein
MIRLIAYLVSSWYLSRRYEEGDGMRVVETKVEPLETGRFRITTIVEEEPPLTGRKSSVPRIGDGPTGEAVPDKIVKALIKHRPRTLAVAEIQRELGGNPGTVNRQAWTLATNAPDLQIRLKGWVVSPERGHYALSPAARERLDMARSD